jgi:hypothetical protein
MFKSPLTVVIFLTRFLLVTAQGRIFKAYLMQLQSIHSYICKLILRIEHRDLIIIGVE